VSLIVALAHLGWTFGPFVLFERVALPTEGQERPFRLFSTNVMAWQITTDGIVSEILREDADVVAVQELSPIWAEAFDGPEFRRAYPHRITEVRADASGSGIYSRTPFTHSDILTTPSMPIARATIRVGPSSTPVRLYSVHVLPPSHHAWVDEWSKGLQAIEEAALRESLPVILAGDFNATQHSSWYSRFQSDGFRACHDLRGRSLATTWPNGVLPVPPIRIDHVFLSPSLKCTHVREGIGVGSDHRPVIVELRATLPSAKDASSGVHGLDHATPAASGQSVPNGTRDASRRTALVASPARRDY